MSNPSDAADPPEDVGEGIVTSELPSEAPPSTETPPVSEIPPSSEGPSDPDPTEEIDLPSDTPPSSGVPTDDATPPPDTPPAEPDADVGEEIVTSDLPSETPPSSEEPTDDATPPPDAAPAEPEPNPNVLTVPDASRRVSRRRSPGDLAHEGSMIKCGSLWRSWKKRHFRLQWNGDLKYFRSSGGKFIKEFSVVGMILQCVPRAEKSKEFCLNLAREKKNFYFFATNQADYDAWVDKLTDVLAHSKSVEVISERHPGLSGDEKLLAQEIEFGVLKQHFVYIARRYFINGELVSKGLQRNLKQAVSSRDVLEAKLTHLFSESWVLFVDFAGYQQDFSTFAECERLGDLLHGRVFRSVVENLERLVGMHPDNLRLMKKQARRRVLSLRFVDQPSAVETVVPVTATEEEEEEGETDLPKSDPVAAPPTPGSSQSMFMEVVLDDGTLFVSVQRGHTSWRSHLVSPLELARCFFTDSGLRLDTFLNLNDEGDRAKKQVIQILSSALEEESPFELEFDVERLVVGNEGFLGSDVGRFAEIVLRRYFCPFAETLASLLAKDVNDFIKQRLFKHCPAKILSFDWVETPDDIPEAIVAKRDGKFVFCAAKVQDWIISDDDMTSKLLSEGALSSLLTDRTSEVDVYLGVDVQRHEKELSKRLTDDLWNASAEKGWSFDIDWLRLQQYPTLEDSDLQQLCTIVYRNFMEKLVEGFNRVLTTDEDSLIKKVMMERLPMRQLSFRFVKTDPGVDHLQLAIDRKGILWIEVFIDPEKQWIEKGECLMNDPNLLMEVIGSNESIPLVIQLHDRKAGPSRDSVLRKLSDLFGMTFEIDLDWIEIYGKLKEMGERSDTMGIIGMRYFRYLAGKAQEYLMGDGDHSKRDRFLEVFHAKKMRLDLDPTSEAAFTNCGVVNKGDGVLYVVVKSWGQGFVEFGTGEHSLENILSQQ